MSALIALYEEMRNKTSRMHYNPLAVEMLLLCLRELGRYRCHHVVSRGDGGRIAVRRISVKVGIGQGSI